MDPSPAVGGEIVDAAEMKKVALMRALVEAKDPSAKEEDDLMLRRFLRARDLDIEKGSSLFLKYLEWKRHSVPNGYISKAEVQNELAHKKVFLQGFDKQQRPIAVVFAARHYSSKRDIEEFKRLSVHVLDELCSRMPRGQEKFICIGDLQGWGYSNCDIRAYLASLDIMQVAIAPEDQEKTTFTCPYVTFAYRRMSFGLCHAPATFQRCMMEIRRSLWNEEEGWNAHALYIDEHAFESYYAHALFLEAHAFGSYYVHALTPIACTFDVADFRQS